MARLLIYLFPLLIDMALGCAWYVCTARRAAEPGATAGDVTWLLTLWAATYMVVCRLIGCILTERNAVGMVIVGSLSVTAVAGGFILVPGIGHMWWLLMLQAVAVALFFVPFQVFMKQASAGGESGIVRPTALYTASWSLGLAAGPSLGAWLWALWGWQAAYGINVAVGVATAAGIALLRRAGERPAEAPAAARSGCPASGALVVDCERDAPADRYRGQPDLIWLAWVGCGAGFVAIATIRALLPTATRIDGVSKTHLGMILAALALAHSLTALVLLPSRWWMYRPRGVLAFALFGLAGLALFATADGLASYYAAAVCFGIYSSGFCFYFVFHALVHPSKSASYVAVNEAVVGLTAIIGPFAGGRVADATSLAVPFWGAAALVAAAVVLQAAVHARHARRLPAQ
ncbi:MAG: MFS transporter [Planctomycetes bacterium]|nr:MFS transporter [Planctomycetota bacterium]